MKNFSCRDLGLWADLSLLFRSCCNYGTRPDETGPTGCDNATQQRSNALMELHVLCNSVLDEFVNRNSQLLNIFKITFFKVYYPDHFAASFVVEHISSVTHQLVHNERCFGD